MPKTPMLRFDRLIRASMIVRDIKHLYPETTPILEELGFRPICDDCSIQTVAQRQGLSALDVVDALNQAVNSNGDRCRSSSASVPRPE